MELPQYGIEYAPRPSIKAQALADFIIECSAYPVEGSLVEGSEAAELWEIQTDGAAGSKHYAVGVMITTPEGFCLYYVLRYNFQTSNNEAEYEAVIRGLQLVIALHAARVRVMTDSRLVVNQLKNECVTREERLVLYKDVAEGLLDKLEANEITHIPRAENTEADILSKLALGSTPSHLSMACRTEVIERSSTEVLSVCTVVRVSSSRPDHATPFDWLWFADMVRYKEKAE
ncbi:PREDICTED: uncharacterized protein LOC109167354 [Ipomoea nil]|uniref:uncharacterized protein LOC109167354 n=1 Tax=Ipomoea nil TaxID=35883 RepID=UPI0009012521|nr:PREDICTED: uncharacterized protein LOC109167354 [Ipomoea nil]